MDSITGPHFHPLRLETGTVPSETDRGQICFLITEHTHDKAFIRERAGMLLRSGCRRFRFCGDQAQDWYFAAGETDEDLNGGIAMPRICASWEGFLEEIRKELETGTDDVFLLYDDEQTFRTALFGLMFGEPCYPDAGTETAEQKNPSGSDT